MEPWTYHPDPLLQRPLAEQLTVFPRQADMTETGLRLVWTLLLRGVLRVYFRLRIVGREHLPVGRPFVLVGNHSSHLDAISLTAALPVRSIHRVYAAAAKDYFFKTFWRSVFSGIFLGALPFDRKAAPRQSLEMCAEVLRASANALIIFPEGTRSLTGEVQPFKPGVGVLVAGTETPVIPAYIDGAFRAWGKGSAFPKPRRVTVYLGSPRSYGGAPRAKEGYRHVAADLESTVRELAAWVEGERA